MNEEALKYLLELLRNSCEKLLRFCSGASNEIAAPYLARMIVLMLHIFKYAETYKIILNERWVSHIWIVNKQRILNNFRFVLLNFGRNQFADLCNFYYFHFCGYGKSIKSLKIKFLNVSFVAKVVLTIFFLHYTSAAFR